jgi:hypothetical protein
MPDCIVKPLELGALSNLFVTIQKGMGVKADSFADSSGEMKEVLSS